MHSIGRLSCAHSRHTVGNVHEEFCDLMNPSAHAILSNVAAAVAVRVCRICILSGD